VQVGDILLIHEGETFPADLVLLSSSNGGDCFIKTSSLDGEKNLKKRTQAKDLGEHFPANTIDPSAFLKVKGELQCDLPNNDLHRFNGQIIINNKYYTLTDKQLLLKGANLQNTEWVVALCVYTGEETKIMLNS
jgi:magnesium-transporting ATPase (P-type)